MNFFFLQNDANEDFGVIDLSNTNNWFLRKTFSFKSRNKLPERESYKNYNSSFNVSLACMIFELFYYFFSMKLLVSIERFK